MLTKEQLLLIQNKFQTLKANVLREYVQHLFLSSLYRTNGSENILFKGGTGYRIAYKSPRFSEDLDFSASQISIKEIEKIMINVLKIYPTTDSFVILKSQKYYGWLSSQIIYQFQGEKIPIDIQISLKRTLTESMRSSTS